MLAELETQSRKEAYHGFVAAVWEGEEPSRLLARARAAGLSGQEADAFVARVGQAREQLAQANRLPRLRKEAAKLGDRHGGIKARADAEISRLEEEVRCAAWEADAAQQAVNEAEDCSRQMLRMYDAGELPATEAPEEVFRLIEQRDAEAHYHVVCQARVGAEDRRNRIRTLVQNLEHRLKTLPISITRAHDEVVLENQLKEGRQMLAEAETILRMAEMAEDTARRATS